jgi:uncharacterized protein YaaQ
MSKFLDECKKKDEMSKIINKSVDRLIDQVHAKDNNDNAYAFAAGFLKACLTEALVGKTENAISMIKRGIEV